MLLAKKIIKYIETDKYNNYSNLYLCSKSYSHLNYDKSNVNYIKKEELSLYFKSKLKLIDNYLIINNEHFDILEDKNNSEKIKAIMIIKIDSNRFAVYTNNLNYFEKKDLDYYINFSKGLLNYITR